MLLVVAAAQRPLNSRLSLFELERRAKRSSSAKTELERERALPHVRALIRLKYSFLLVMTVVLLIVTFGWALGIVLAIVVAFIYIPLALSKPFAHMGARLYRAGEPYYMNLIKKGAPVFALLRESPLYAEHHVDSREELQNLIEQSGEALTDIERKIIVHALDFNDTLVSSVMTPRNTIDSIKKGEFLGPLVLDELHALGHSRLPVIDGDLDHIVGILYLRDLLSLDVKRSSTVEKAMDSKVYYIRDDENLEHALAAFLKARHHLFIVINAQRETVGLLSLEDTIEALIGRRILDEDDNHDDLRAVAESKGRSNNSPLHHVDV